VYPLNLVGSNILITQNKRLGIVSEEAEPSDTIALLLGGEVPIVLRLDGDGKYCYVHGFMDGEGLVEARHAAEPYYDVNETSWVRRLVKSHFLLGPIILSSSRSLTLLYNTSITWNRSGIYSELACRVSRNGL
jgi:hypothetical protein